MNKINLDRYKRVKEAVKDCKNEELKSFNASFSLSRWLYCLEEHIEEMEKNNDK